MTLLQLRGIAGSIKYALRVPIILKVLTRTIKFAASSGVRGQGDLRSGSFEQMSSSAQRLTQILLGTIEDAGIK